MRLVDVQNTQKSVIVNRELMDAVPTARNYSGMAALIQGVRMSNTDVGGNQQMEQIYMTVNGSRQTDTTVQVDGLNLNSLMNDGQVQAYYSDAAMAETTYQTSGITADVSTGGVRINLTPKDGGNVFSGQAFVGGTDGSWQANNVTDELQARGLRTGSRVAKIADVNIGIGGPIMRDKLWFFASWRRIATDSVIPGSYFANTGEVGTGVEEQWIMNNMLRLTWQVNQKNKFSAYYDRYPKFKGHETIVGAVAEWDSASGRRDPQHAIYYTSQAKWTSILSSKLLLETGFSTNVEYLYIGYQPGVQKQRNSPEWFNTIGKSDVLSLRAYDGRITPANGIDPKVYNVTSQVSYVTGSHALKTGVNWTFGNYVLEYDINGDLVQLYRNGVPDAVRVYNTPVRGNEYLNGNIGMFVQDSWTLDRMTLNLGVRFEHFTARIKNQTAGAGRFAPERSFSEVTGMPNWFDVAPRLGVSYDLFGNAAHRAQSDLRPLHGGPDHRIPGPLQPAAAPERHAHLEGYQRRQPRTGQRDRSQQQRRVRLGGADTAARPRHPPRVRPRVHRLGPARSEAGPVGDRRLLPPRRLQPAADAEQRLVAQRLHHRTGGEPARRIDPARLQPRPLETRQRGPHRLQLNRLKPAQPHLQRRPAGVQRQAGRRPVLRRLDGRSTAWILAATPSRATRVATPARRPSPPTMRRSPIVIGAIRASSTCPGSTKSSLQGRTGSRGTSRSTSRSRATTGCRCSRAGTCRPPRDTQRIAWRPAAPASWSCRT